MLETIAAIAGIIGFSMQVFDQFKASHPGPMGREMAALKSLSITGKNWKNIHSKYHAIERNIPELLATIETVNNGRRETLPPDRVLPLQIKDVLENPNWLDIITTIERELSPPIKTLRQANTEAKERKESVLEELRKKGKTDIAERIETITISQEDIITCHDEFLKFKNNIFKFIHDNTWGPEQVEYLIRNRRILIMDIPSIIGSTDNALMAILDLYNFIIDEA